MTEHDAEEPHWLKMARLKAKLDPPARLQYAYEEGYRQGFQQGYEEMLQYRRSQGMHIGAIRLLQELLNETPSSREELVKLDIETLEAMAAILRERVQASRTR